MDREILDDIFFFVAAIVGMGCFTGIVISLIKWRRKPQLTGEATARLDQIADRLSRLETAVDATAVEIERISEGQRFTTKLLSERSSAPAGADRDRQASR